MAASAADPLKWADGNEDTPPFQWEALDTDGRWWITDTLGTITYIGTDPLPATLEFDWEIVVPPGNAGGLNFDYLLDGVPGSEPLGFVAATGSFSIAVANPAATFSFEIRGFGIGGLYGGVVALLGPNIPTVAAVAEVVDCDYTDDRISGAYCYADFEIAEHLEEAFERGPKMAPSAIGDEHLNSALRSIKYLLNSEWTTIGIRQWLIVQATQLLTTGENSFRLPDGGLDIFTAVLRRSGVDVPMARMSRAENTELPNHTGTGRPDRYFVDRRYNQALVYLWRTPENSTDVMVFDYFRQAALPGSDLSNKLQMPPMFLEAFVAGLAARLAMKYRPADWGMLQTYYRGSDPSKIGGVLGDAINEDRDRTDTQYRLIFNSRGRR